MRMCFSDGRRDGDDSARHTGQPDVCDNLCGDGQDAALYDQLADDCTLVGNVNIDALADVRPGRAGAGGPTRAPARPSAPHPNEPLPRRTRPAPAVPRVGHAVIAELP